MRVLPDATARVEQIPEPTHTMQLQGKFVAISLPALTIALVVLGCIVYSKLVSEKQELLEIQMTTASAQISQRFSRKIQQLQTSANLLAEAAPVIDWFDPTKISALEPHVDQKVRGLFERLRATHPDFREMRLVGKDGYEQIRVADSSLVNRTQDERGSTWFSKLALTPNTDTSVSITNQADDGATTVTVSTPVYDAHSARSSKEAIAGYVVIDVAISDFAKNLNNLAVRDDSYTVLLNEKLEIVHAPDAYVADAQMLRTYLLSTDPPSAHDTKIEQVVIDGKTCMLGQHMIGEGLILLIVSPPSTLQTIKSELLKTVGIATVAVITLLSLFFSWLVRWIVVAPIGRLQASVTELLEGRPDSTRQSTRNDEIGQLARSFTHLNTQLSESMQQLQETSLRNKILAYHDGLTGLPNRRHFADLLNNTLEKAADTNSNVAVMFIDLNDFKRLNDTIGHQAGDELLIITGNRLQQTFKQLSEDAIQTHPNLAFEVARLAGDEFVVLLSGFENTAFVTKAANLLIADLCQPASVENTQWPLEASVGISLFPEHAAEEKNLLACADLAMYEAKRAQTSCWRIYTLNIGEESNSQAA